MCIYSLDLSFLAMYVKRHRKQIYCIYAGIEENWEDTSDEIYFYGMGWISNNNAHIICSSDEGYPIAYIHYFDDVNEDNLISEYKRVVVVR